MNFFSSRVKKVGGFTLIELLISVSLFAMVILIATGTLLNLARANDRAQAVLVALNNLDFALENMARNLRTGTGYSNDPSGITSISFTDSDSNQVMYYLNTEPDSPNGRIIRYKNGAHAALTAPEIDIRSLSFYIAGTGDSDDRQPKVFILLTGRTAIPGLKQSEQIDFNLQTTVSQRSPDI